MEQRLTVVTLGVADVKKATDFYETKLGWKRTSSSNEKITFIQLNGGMLLSLYNQDELAKDATVENKSLSSSGGSFKGFTLAYNCRSKQEVDDVFATLQSKGVKIVKPPQDVFWGGYSGYFSDIDDNLWEVAYNPFLTLDVDGNVVDDESKNKANE